MAEETQDGQKTLVAFVVGLLIGGMLVWAFSGPSADAPETADDDPAAEESTENGDEGGTSDEEMSDGEDTEANGENNSDSTEETATLEVGDGSVTVNDQPAGTSVELESATYPVSEGWIGVREYNNEELGFILGVVRFSESQGLVPNEIVLQRPTTPGNRYAIVVFTEDGDFDFSLAGDAQIDQVFDTFVAQ
jgi:hypothetical protein